jgi:hypothetical protein
MWGGGVMEWIQMTQHRGRRRVVVNAVMNFGFRRHGVSYALLMLAEKYRNDFRGYPTYLSYFKVIS